MRENPGIEGRLFLLKKNPLWSPVTCVIALLAAAVCHQPGAVNTKDQVVAVKRERYCTGPTGPTNYNSIFSKVESFIHFVKGELPLVLYAVHL